MPQYNNLTYINSDGDILNLGNDPASWPEHYTDNNNNQYVLECTCSNMVNLVGETTDPVTLAVCDSINGNWIPNSPHPVPIPPSHLGRCYAPPAQTTCSEYVSSSSINGVEVSWSIAKITIPENLPYYAGELVIDPCDFENYTINNNTAPGLISFPKLEENKEQYINYCHSLRDILPCDPKMSYISPQNPIQISINNNTINPINLILAGSITKFPSNPVVRAYVKKLNILNPKDFDKLFNKGISFNPNDPSLTSSQRAAMKRTIQILKDIAANPPKTLAPPQPPSEGLIKTILNIFKGIRLPSIGPIMIMPILPEIPTLGGGQTASTGKVISIGFDVDGNLLIADLDIDLNLIPI